MSKNFRAWVPEANSFIYSDDITALLDEKTLLVFGCGKWNKHEVEKVEFSTGLTDKNGKEIYEGDIVPLTTNEETSYEWVEDVSRNYVIKFIRGGFALHKDGVKPYGSWYWLHNKAHMLEIIGNIYENPELINHEK